MHRSASRFVFVLAVLLGGALPADQLVCVEGPEILVRVERPCEPFTTTVGIQNMGAAPLTIAAVEQSCGCTEASLDRHELAPGDIAALTVTVQTVIKTAERVDERITIRTVGGGSLVLPVVGEHPYCFRLNRREAVFGTFDLAGDVPSALMIVDLNPDADLRTVTATPLSGRVAVAALPADPKFPHAVLFSVSPSLPVALGTTEEFVQFKVGEVTIGTLRVSWTAASRLVEVSESPVYFPPTRRGERGSRRVDVMCGPTTARFRVASEGEVFSLSDTGWRYVGAAGGEAIAIDFAPTRIGLEEGRLFVTIEEKDGRVHTLIVPVVGYGM